ncbi:hypothetical protein ACLB2K_047504 [Fragaria x ananassa]
MPKLSRPKSFNRNKRVAPEDFPEEKLEKTDKTQISPESVPAPEASPAVALVTETPEEKPQSTDFGDFSWDHKLHPVSGSSYFNATLTNKNGKTKDVSFVPFDEAEGNTIFDTYTCNKTIYDERVIRPYFIIYCKDISKYIICYDRFDCYLKDWLPKWLGSNCVKDLNGLPHMVIKTEISKLLKSVSNIHKTGLLHLSLSDISNYVVIDENWYIINVSGTLDKSYSKWKSEILSDFHGFRDMLKDNVLTDTSWQERNDFLNTFDMPITYLHRLVPILLDHVFTKSSRERLRMFSEIRHGWMDPSRKCNMLSTAISKGYFECYTKGGWDKDKDQMGVVLSRIYNYQNYKGENILSLLKFLRNVYEHYNEHKGNVVDIEKENPASKRESKGEINGNDKDQLRGDLGSLTPVSTPWVSFGNGNANDIWLVHGM